MEGQNFVRLDGAVATEPQLARVGNDLARLTFTVAGVDRLPGDDGQPRTSAWYHAVTLFGRYAEVMEQHLRVGAAVSVKGRINHHEYTKDGDRRSITNVVGDSVTILDAGTYGDAALSIDAKGQPRLEDADNLVEISGNLTKDAVHSVTANQQVPVTSFRVAINRPNRGESDAGGVDYLDVVAWRDLALASATLRKGDGVLVRGRLVTNSFEDKGVRRYSTLVDAQRVRPAQRRAAARDDAAPAKAAPAKSAPAKSAPKAAASVPTRPPEIADDSMLPF
jgi:single-strand DNA-binding protein